MTATEPTLHPPQGPSPAPVIDPTDSDARTWDRLLVWAVAVVAAVDAVFLGLVGEVIPPLAVSLVGSAIGLGLLKVRRRLGIGLLGGVSLLLLFGGLPFVVGHLAHPESGVDWFHAVVGTGGRVVAILAAVGALRELGQAGARRVGTVSAGLTGLAVVVAGVATLGSTGAEAQPGDVPLTVEAAEFEPQIAVSAGEVLFVDNRDLFRHTFTVEGTRIDAELPAGQGVRVAVDLEPGTYPVICALPGHERMASTLVVR